MRSQPEITSYKQDFFKKEKYLTKKDFTSLLYHDIFDYPLTSVELIRWQPGKKVKVFELGNLLFKHKSGHFYLDGREGIVLRRLMRQRASDKKMRLAKKAVKLLSFVPTVKMVAVTGALAMKNTDEISDIDLFVITKKNSLWITRAISLALLKLFSFPVRRFGEKEEKDKLCLNIWLDETDLCWKKRNIYTAHEIAQTTPLFNKEKTFESFVKKNLWVKDYWPNALRIRKSGPKAKETSSSKVLSRFICLFEKSARKLQYLYMRKKITKETVTKTKALFHPVDWSEYVLTKLEGKLQIAS